MKRRGSSQRWRERQQRDPYVKGRDREGLRSRAAFKLQELDGRDRLLKSGMRVVDLGASPGGWTQHAVSAVGERGTVVAVDVLNMEAIPGSIFIRGDCREPAVMKAVEQALGGQGAQLVMSDMAPNITGIAVTDEAAAEVLWATTLDFVRALLQPEGALLMKLFEYPATEDLLAEIRENFAHVARRKPPASRARSREFYVVARGYGV